MEFKDYYATLGVAKTASAKEIKQAFRKLARKFHPDVNPGDKSAEGRFKEINEAYEVLSDPEKRAKYDALGADWKRAADFTPPQGARPEEAGFGEWGEFGDFSDFFSSMFGRASARDRRGGPVRRRGEDLEAEITLPLESLLRPGPRRVNIRGQSIEVEIPPGVRDGTILRIAGRGGPGVNEGPPGDLYLRVRVPPHPRYRVSGDDLEVDLPLQPWQAVLGDTVTIETIDGPVKLKVPPGTQSGRRLRLRGRGLPRTDGGRGNLYAAVRIVVPEHPTPSERTAYEALKRHATAGADQPDASVRSS